MKKSFKNFLVAAIATVTTVAMSTMAFAAPSPQAAGTVTDATTADGVKLTVVPLSASQVNLSKKQESDIVKKLGVDMKDITCIACDITAPKGIKFPTDIMVTIPGINLGTPIAVYHKPTNGGWQEEDPLVTAVNTLTIKNIKSFSPFAFFVPTKSLGDSKPGTDSPKTGSSPIVPFAGIVAIVALTGAVVVYKKKAC